MRSLILYILLLFPFILPAQDITGVWTGFVHTSDKHLPYEVIISEENGKMSGYSHITFYVSGLEMVAVKTLKVKSEDGKIILEDDDLIFDNFRDVQPKKMKQSSILSLTIEDTVMTLAGSFKTNKTRDLRPASGEVMLQKAISRSQTKLFAKLDEMKLLANLSFLKPKPIKDDIAMVTTDVQRPKQVTNETVKTEVPVKLIEPIIQSEQKNNVVAVLVPKPLEPPPVEVKEKKVTIVGTRIKPDTQPIVLQPELKETRIITPAETGVQPKPTPAIPSIAAIKKPIPVQPKEDKTIAVNKPVTQPAKPIVTNPTPAVVKRPVDIVPTGSAVDIAKRKIETIESVTFKTDSLVLSLYDNGEVDGDTVSVLINGKIIIGKQGLTTNAITKTIYITPDMGDSLQLIMYAENLGSLPPNTGLLIIQDGNERHEIRFAGDLQKNAAILLRRRK